MAGQNLAPFPWVPTSKSPNGAVNGIGRPAVGGNVGAGDWVMVTLSYRENNSSPVIYSPGYFLVHAIYTVTSDDATPHPDQPITMGGGAANRRSNYRVDPGWAFQAPFDGQISVIAGGDSDPNTCTLDVIVRVGKTPRDIGANLELQAAIAYGIADPDMRPWTMGIMQPIGRRIYPPPVIGVPQKVPSTWINVPIGTPVNFPDGAAEIEIVDNSGIPANPIPLTISTLGNAVRMNVASGQRRAISGVSQGGACTNGTPATWQTSAPTGTLGTVTVWSSLGC